MIVIITVSDLTLEFSGTPLFKDVNLLFTAGNCYGVIGANGAGKSTFLKLLSGELEPSKGDISIPPKMRMSVLKQDHYQYDEHTVMDSVIMGNARLYQIMMEKDELYAKEDFTQEDGEKASELEAEFLEMDGWDAQTDAAQLLQGLGITADLHEVKMNTLTGAQKVKVLLAQALFGKPDIILLDEPTNHLDVKSVEWLCEFLINYHGTLIVVSHDRHFLNTVSTHIVDIDFNKIKMYVGNYDFWYESSKLIQQMLRDQNKKYEEKAKELQNFIARFQANKSKSKQATSRKKMLDKLPIEELPASSRRYPWVSFKPEREVGKEILTVENISYTSEDGIKLLNNVSFRVNKGDKIALICENEVAVSALFKILLEEITPDSGSFKWGISTSRSYFPKDNSAFFNDCEYNLIDWMRQFSSDETENFQRGFLGRMLFSGDDVYKFVKVLSGGEKVRCMLSRMMLSSANVLLLDQPTNHLDLEAITAVNNALIDFKEIVIFSSQDHQFIETVANRIIKITDDGIIDRQTTYEEFIEQF